MTDRTAKQDSWGISGTSGSGINYTMGMPKKKTKQEEIRVGLEEFVSAYIAGKILNYLDSQGVVIQTFRSVEVSPGHVMSGEVNEPLIEVKE